MRSTRQSARRGLVVAAALLAGLLVAACGSSTAANASSSRKAASTTASSRRLSATAARAAFTACLKQHGVSAPAHGAVRLRRRHHPATGAAPSPARTSGSGAGAGRVRIANPKLVSARRACRSKLGRGRRGFRRRFGSAARRLPTAVLRSYVTCVRKYGYAKMPEPNTAGHGPVFPASVTRSTQFRAASGKCVIILERGLKARSTGSAGTNTSLTTATT